MSDILDAEDLVLSIDCDHDLYKRRWRPIVTTLTKRKHAGTYNHKLATKAFKPLINEGARKHLAEFPGDRISAAVKREAAADMRDRFEIEFDLGNYEYLVE